MGQDDIFDWLRRKRLEGNEGFFSVKEIRAGLNAENFSSNLRVYEQCLQLYRFGVLEMRRKGVLIGGYRVKKKYCSIEGNS